MKNKTKRRTREDLLKEIKRLYRQVKELEDENLELLSEVESCYCDGEPPDETHEEEVIELTKKVEELEYELQEAQKERDDFEEELIVTKDFKENLIDTITEEVVDAINKTVKSV